MFTSIAHKLKNTKQMKISIHILLIVFISILLSNCKKEDTDPLPVVVTGNVGEVGSRNVIIFGEIISKGSSEITANGFCWSTNPNPTIAGNYSIAEDGVGAFWKSITGLRYGTEYYFRTFATNIAGTAYGSQVKIKTIPTPLAVSAELINNKSTSVSLLVNVTSDGDPTVTDRGICWGVTNTPTIEDNKTSYGAGTGCFSLKISPLLPNKSYHFRAYASDGKIVTYSGVITIITPSPLAVSVWLREKGTDYLVIDGSVLSDGGSLVTTRGVCWGTSNPPTIANSKTNEGKGIGSFSTKISVTDQSLPLYFRTFAINSDTIIYSKSITF